MPPDSSTRHIPWAAPFDRAQTQGAERRRWIAFPDEPGCYIHRSELTYSDLRTNYPSGLTWDHSLAEDFVATPMLQEIPELHDPPQSYRDYTLLSQHLHWSGTTGPGIIVIYQIDRTQFNEEVPLLAPVSAVSQAIYEHNFHIDSLRHVYVNDITNTDTRELVQGRLYNPAYATMHSYIHRQIPGWDLRVWSYGMPEYDAILGTRIGKIVAYLVLGAFERGRMRISRIVTYSLWTRPDSLLHMRFDIERPAFPFDGHD